MDFVRIRPCSFTPSRDMATSSTSSAAPLPSIALRRKIDPRRKCLSQPYHSLKSGSAGCRTRGAARRRKIPSTLAKLSDYQVNLMSLPMLFGTTLANIPAFRSLHLSAHR